MFFHISPPSGIWRGQFLICNPPVSWVRQRKRSFHSPFLCPRQGACCYDIQSKPYIENVQAPWGGCVLLLHYVSTHSQYDNLVRLFSWWTKMEQHRQAFNSTPWRNAILPSLVFKRYFDSFIVVFMYIFHCKPLSGGVKARRAGKLIN